MDADNPESGPWGGAPQVIEGGKTARGGDEPPVPPDNRVTTYNVFLVFFVSLFLSIPVIILVFALRLGWLLAERVVG